MILISRIGLIIAFLSLVSMVLGHFGSHELNLISSQISTYAAKAPYDYLITTSMLLSSLTLLIISFINSKFQIFGSSHLAHFIPALSGAASFGLVMLAYYEETAKNLSVLKQSGFMAIRIQSFHDAGLLMFFYSSLSLAVLLGTLTIIYNYNKINRVLGGIILCMAPISFMLMTTKWPKAIGIEGATIGLNQRAALLCLWLAFTLVLVMVSNKSFKATPKSGVV
ncbi:MAG: DUF998 domain-containing protein [Deltaproteobacteria bacterium]|nr:DUF998 domain-containing protein [Deltaproteobacteria bacterium]